MTDPAHPDGTVAPLVDHLFRSESGRLVALLTRVLGPAHLALAEDVTQEALLAALHHWPTRGIPTNPSAWVYVCQLWPSNRLTPL